MLSGCYRDPIASFQKSLDGFKLNTVEEQINGMKQSVSDLKSLQSMAGPMVESLDRSCAQIAAEIERLRSTLDPQSSEADSVKAQVIALQDQYDRLKAASDAFAKLNLIDRIEEIEQFVQSNYSQTESGTVALEAMEITYALMADIAPLGAAIELLPSQFEAGSQAFIEKSVERIASWVTEDPEFCELVGKFYTKEALDKKVAELEQLNAVQDSDILVCKAKYDSLCAAFPQALEKAIKGVTDDLGPQIEAINSTLQEMVSLTNDLVARVEVLEKAAAVVGDFSSYKSNLIADILALQAAVGDEGTLTSLVNALKLVLSDGQDSYYNTHEAIQTLYENSDSLEGHDKRIAALEKLSAELAKADDLEKLIERSETLGKDIEKNKTDIGALVERVDAFVKDWTQTLFATYEQNISDIADLKSQDEKLWLVIGSAQEGAETGIFKTLADIDVAIVNFNIGELRENVTKINSLLSNCGIDGVTGLQDCLENIDGRIKAILGALIGSDERLAIGANLIDAVNKLYALFGQMPSDSTVLDLVNALKADIGIIKGEGWSDGVNLASLDKLSKDLVAIMDTKDTKIDVGELSNTVKAIQGTLLTLMTTESFDDTLKSYLTTADAEKTYAKALDLENFIKSFNELFGVEETPAAAGTVLGRLSKLENAVGNAQFTDGWIGNLTAAVNTLHSLVGSTSAEDQAKAISEEIVDELVKKVLGLDNDKTHAQIAEQINAFAAEIAAFKDFEADLSEAGKFEGHTSMDDAVAQVYSVLATYLNDHNVDGTFGKLCERFLAIEEAVGAEFFTYGYSLREAYEKISNLLGPVGTGDSSAKSLLANLGKQYDDLIKALLGNSGKPEDITADLSLAKLKQRIDELAFSNAKGEFRGKTVTVAEALSQLNAKMDTLNTILGVGEGNYNLSDSLNNLKSILGTFKYGDYTETVEAMQGRLDRIIGILSHGTGEYTDIKALADSLDALYEECKVFGFDNDKFTSSLLNELDNGVKQIQDIIGDMDGLTNICDEIRALQNAVPDGLGDYIGRSLSSIFDQLESVQKIKKYIGLPYFINVFDFGLVGEDFEKGIDTEEIVAAVNIVLDALEKKKEEGIASRADLEALRDLLMGGTATPYETIVKLDSAVRALEAHLEGKPEDWYKDEEGNFIDLYSGIEKMDKAFENFCKEVFGQPAAITTEHTIWEEIDILLAMTQGSLGSLINSMYFMPEYTDGKATLNSQNNHTVFGSLVMNFKVNANSRLAERFAKDRDIKGYVRNKEKQTEIEGVGTYRNGVFTASFNSDQFAASFIPEEGTVFVSVAIFDAGEEQYRTNYVPVLISHEKFKRIKSADPESGTTIIFPKRVGGSKTIILAPEIAGDNLTDISCTITNPDNYLSVNAEAACTKLINAKAGSKLDSEAVGTVTYSDGIGSFVYNVKRVEAWSPDYYKVDGATVSGSTVNVPSNASVKITVDLNALNTTGNVGGSVSAQWIDGFKCNLRSDNVIEITFNREWTLVSLSRDLTVTVDGQNLFTITLKPD